MKPLALGPGPGKPPLISPPARAPRTCAPPRAVYCGMMFFAPAFWLGDNFVDADAPTNATALAMCKIIGVLVFCCALLTYIIRTNGVNLQTADYATVVAWSACAAVTFTDQELYKPQAFLQNIGLQGTIAAMYAYQGFSRPQEKAKGQ